MSHDLPPGPSAPHEAHDCQIWTLPETPDCPALQMAVYPPDARAMPPAAGPALVLHLYGHSGSCRNFNIGRPPYAELRRLLRLRGDWLLIPELGPRPWMNASAVDALDRSIDHMVQQHGIDPRRVHIVGTSMGAGSGLAYVMQRPGRIRSVCAVFPMTDFPQWCREHPGYLESIAAAHQLSGSALHTRLTELSALHHPEVFRDMPIYLLHAADDRVVPPQHSLRFYQALRDLHAPVRLQHIPSGGHQDAIVAPYQSAIAEFLTGDPTA